MYVYQRLLPSDCITDITQALTAYKALIPDFNGFLNQLPLADQQALRTTYNL